MCKKCDKLLRWIMLNPADAMRVMTDQSDEIRILSANNKVLREDMNMMLEAMATNE